MWPDLQGLKFLTFEFLVWGSLYFLPLPSAHMFSFTWSRRPLLSRQRASSGRQKMHFRVWMKS